MLFFTEIEKKNPKICTESEKILNGKNILSKKNKARGIILSDFKIYDKAIVTKTAGYWYKNRHKDQWNRTENPERNPHTYSEFIFNKVTKNIH